VNGLAYGGGLELILACDIILASEDAVLGLPEIKLGLIPGFGGPNRLHRVAGKGLAMLMTVTGDSISAMEAKEYGIVSDVYKKEELHEEAVKLGRKIAEKPLGVLTVAKEAVGRAERMGLTQGLQVERGLFNSLFGMRGTREGVGAFLEKRKPNFEDM